MRAPQSTGEMVAFLNGQHLPSDAAPVPPSSSELDWSSASLP